MAIDPAAKNVIVVHASAEWSTFHRAGMLVALADALPSGTALLAVNRPISIDVGPWKHPRKFWSRFWHLDHGTDDHGIRTLTPRLLLHEQIAAKVPFATSVNLRLMRQQLASVKHRYFPNATKEIHWIYHPAQRWVWGLSPRAGKVYECYDEHSHSASGKVNPQGWQREQIVLGEADLCFAATRSLIPSRAPVAKRLDLLPNGVPDHFFRTKRETIDKAFQSVPRPRLVYLGNIFPRVDCRLLEELMTRNPQWHLVLVGPGQEHASVARLQRLGNVHCFGEQPYARVPAILHEMDVGLIPFVLNDFTRAISPLKLYEYMATGLPVVSTHLPELLRFGKLIKSADNVPESFARAVAELLAADQDELRSALVSTAEEFSWSRIVHKHVIPALRDVFTI